MAVDPAKIEERIDRVVTGSIELSDEGGGIEIKRLVDAMEIAKLMSISGPAIPSFMRNQPGICYACVVRAVRWQMDPFFVAEMSYLVNNKGEEKIAFMAQLIVAVINASAPLQKKLRVEYTGEGDEMKATIYGLPKGQTEEITYETPTLGQLIKARGKNDYGKLKGSPLYETDAKQQLWYYGARGFCRRHFPEVLAGVYDMDEFEPVDPKDVTPKRESLGERLKGQRRIANAPGRTFDVDQIGAQMKEAVVVGADTVGSQKITEVGAADSDASVAPAPAAASPTSAPKPLVGAAATPEAQEAGGGAG